MLDILARKPMINLSILSSLRIEDLLHFNQYMFYVCIFCKKNNCGSLKKSTDNTKVCILFGPTHIAFEKGNESRT
jgi:hypothetical protein